MLQGRKLRLPGCLLVGSAPDQETVEDFVDGMRDRLNKVHQFARANLNISTERMMAQYNTKANPVNFEIGDLVWFHNPKRKVGLSPKLQNNWDGPYKVTNKLNDLIVRIRKTPGRAKVVHIDRLAHYLGDPVGH